MSEASRAAGARILVCEDEPALREMLDVKLRRLGYAVSLTADVGAAVARLEDEGFDLVLTDLVLPGGSGMDVLARARELHPSAQVVMMTAYATTEQAVLAMRLGAYDYIQKPFKLDELGVTLDKALEKRRLLEENVALRASVKRDLGEFGIVGRSAAMARVRGLVKKMAGSPASVLVTGESGTGKEVVARALHTAGSRATGPFVTVNCGALPENLMESELFGHAKGSFTGASQAHDGVFRAAHGGTLFLDEVGELPLGLQVKLLRVLEERTVRPVGTTKDLPVDVRVVAATNRFLEQDVERGAFRRDLYYRLNILRIHLPPLRERREDVEGLVRHFVAAQAAQTGRPFTVQPEVFGVLARRPLAGNVRELSNLVLRATALATSDALGVDDFEDLDPSAVAESAPLPDVLPEGFDLDAHLAHVEQHYLELALRHAGGVRTAAAKLVGMSFRSFRYRMAKFEGGEVDLDG